MRSKLLHGHDWIRVRPGLNKRFEVPLQPCEHCRRLSLAPAWYSIKSKQIRCDRCFNPND